VERESLRDYLIESRQALQHAQAEVLKPLKKFIESRGAAFEDNLGALT
jgi:hypothetical protein